MALYLLFKILFEFLSIFCHSRTQVLRITSTQALARAAAIKTNSVTVLLIRNPLITITLILTIWIVTTVFVVLPILEHCHIKIEQCFNSSSHSRNFFIIVNGSLLDINSK